MNNRFLQNSALVFIVFIATMSGASAAIRAQVDRPSVDLNESFMLEIIVDTNTDSEPDLTVLEEAFYVGQVSQLSNTSIYNGEIRRSRTWTIALMPKSAGEQEIPSVTVGNEQSAPVKITVNEPSKEPPGEADVFITSEVDQAEAYVQAQILYRIKVYRAVATRQPALREPTISGAEVLVELAGDEKSYEAILNGKAYNVVERVIALYPQQSGEIAISPAVFEARVLRNARITGRKVFQSDAHTVKVLPIPAPPDEFQDAVWLPARDVRLSEEWSRDPERINAGEPVTRRVTVSALGQIETQIPAIMPPSVDGLNIYEDKPELSRRVEAGGIRGIRKDQYAIIGVNGGAIELPELEVPWWDIDAATWRVARLPARTINVKAVDVPVTAAPVVETTKTDVAERAVPPLMPGGFWQRVSQLLAAVWLLTVFAWWWSSRDPKRAPREPEPPPVYKRQAKFLRAARKAALAGDAAAVRSAMLDWGRLQWPDDAPRSVGELAERVATPLAEELQKLSMASYGPGPSEWDGAALAKSLRSITIVSADSRADLEDRLPPLMPPAGHS
ncbi:MAG: BatD family protein [Gammaproteobacteria bacterium]|nr:BatD family protein [Gammaproteobacteria bacterium]MBT8111798.1 BatD family protein [Gammaproteobacteria bacterium]NND47196.1 protein BatD [Woeseiaceae bacterium]NNL46497.1 protein BatD [Woeseiaceae bacterium]